MPTITELSPPFLMVYVVTVAGRPVGVFADRESASQAVGTLTGQGILAFYCDAPSGALAPVSVKFGV